MMRGMRQNILIPFIVFLLVVPTINVLVLNYFFTRYIHNGIEEQLKYTATGSKALIKKNLADIVYETDQEKVTLALNELNNVLRSAKTNLNMELLLFDPNGVLIYPTDYSNTFLTERHVEQIVSVLANLSEDETQTIISDNAKISITGYRLSDLPISAIPFVVFASSLDLADPMLKTMNQMLIVVFLISGIIGVAVSVSIANRVVNPLKTLSNATKKIGKSKEFNIDNKIKIREIADLSVSISEMSSRIKDYDNAQRDFLQNASHEIRTPLMSIQGYAEGIEKGLFSDPIKAGTIIREESKKLTELLEELLLLSRIENRNYEQISESAVLNDVIKEYMQVIEGLALKDGRAVELDICNDKLTIDYNESLFSQSLMNITVNALRYCTAKVKISLLKEGAYALIIVEDDGPGLKIVDIPRLFDRFYKGINGQHGLGLAIAKTATEIMGGYIRAENGLVGAKFIIGIPLKHT